jgi:phage shock protein A
MTDPERDALKQEYEDVVNALIDQRNIAQNQLAQLGAAMRALQRKVAELQQKLPQIIEPEHKTNGSASQSSQDGHANPNH